MVEELENPVRQLPPQQAVQGEGRRRLLALSPCAGAGESLMKRYGHPKKFSIEVTPIEREGE